MNRVRIAALVLVGLGATLVVGCPAPSARLRHGAVPSVDAGAPPAESATAPAPVVEEPSAETLATYAFGGPRRRKDPTDLCEPVKENLERTEREILARRNETRPLPARPWDRRTPPKYMSIVDDRLSLTPAEKTLLAKNGFVVSSRRNLRGYADALHELYQSQLPIYVSTDAILFSVYKSNDALMEAVERTLAPRLEALLTKMHAGLPAAATAYPPEVARDLDIYLTVARSLLAEEDVAAALGADVEAKTLSGLARGGKGGLVTTSLFGRSRVIDVSQYTPRGHYVHEGDETMARYFRASIWLSRLELNLVSRSSRSSQPGFSPNPEETPREAVVALALADLAERTNVLDEIDVFDAFWREFAGKREDVSLRALGVLRHQAGISRLAVPESADKLRRAIGAGYARTTRMHYMPQGSTELPVIATMLGPRVVADAHAESELAHSDVPGRLMPTIADVAFILGHERARDWLTKDLATFPGLSAKLDQGRAIVDRAGAGDLYAAWLGAIRAVAREPDGVKPTFMSTPAFADYKVNTTVAAFGELRHNYVLLAGQPYDMGGCVIPDGYVEPAVAVYEALRAYAKRGVEAMKVVGSKDGGDYFARLDRTLAVLIAIANDELAGRELSLEERRFLSMVAEIVPPSSDGPGYNDGWYFDLFPEASDAFAEHAFVADWYTSSNGGAVVYAGATNPRYGVFVVDTGGEPRVMVGPVARAFEHVGKLDVRLTDTDTAKLKSLREPWAASYVAPDVPAPPLHVFSLGYVGPEGVIMLRSTRALGPVTLEYLGHHRTVVGRKTVIVGAGWSRAIVPPPPTDEWIEVVRVRRGPWVTDIDAGSGINSAFGGMAPIDPEKEWDVRSKMQEIWVPKDVSP